ncbi:MAG: GH36-type glycosyl hydrolase domain-containing protein [Candidatus Hodarchaeota archaeon]
MESNTPFGKWIQDSTGLPAFFYSCREYEEKAVSYFTTSGFSNTHYHLFGNYCWFGFALNHGQVQMLDARRGFTWIGKTSSVSPLDQLGLGACLVKDASGRITCDNTSYRELDERLFGVGYYRKRFKVDSLSITNTLCTPHGDDPVLFSEILVENQENREISVDIGSFWNVFHLPISKSLIVSSNNRKAFTPSKIENVFLRFAFSLQKIFKFDTDGSRQKHAKNITFKVVNADKNLLILKPIHKKESKKDERSPSPINFHYRPVFLTIVNDNADDFAFQKNSLLNSKNVQFPDRKGSKQLEKDALLNREVCLFLSKNVTIPPNSSKKITFLFGVAEDEKIQLLIGKYNDIIEEKSIIEINSDRWKNDLIQFHVEGEPWLEQEISWHGAYLLSSSFKDQYSGFHRIPQSSAYLMGHGFDGSIRDFCLFLYPLIFLKPSLAREFLKYNFSLIDGGKLPYGLHGFGKKLLIPLVHSNPTDLQFFLLWALSEYVYLTRDFDFLDETIVSNDRRQLQQEKTVENLLVSMITYILSSDLGFGPHDLVKVGDGDWNDGITMMVKNRGAFIKNGESMFNSAMLMYTFPRIIPLITRINVDLAETMKDILEKVRKSVDLAWNGKWFFRGYDGRNQPIGNDEIFLDHHVWLLLNPIMGGEKMEILLSNIEKKLIEPSKIGTVIVNPPKKDSGVFPPGWDINGGTWHAINSLLAWGLRVQKPQTAFQFLKKISMRNRAKQYPDIWYGMWTGPDAYNADDADRPGEAFYHAATPMCDFPYANNNLHAGFLISAIRYAGFQSNHGGIKIDLSLDKEFTFRSNLISIEKEKDQIHITIEHDFENSFLLEIFVPDDLKQKIMITPSEGNVEIIDNVIKIAELPDGAMKKFKIQKSN